MKKFKKEQTPDRQVNKIQQNIEEWTREAIIKIQELEKRIKELEDNE